MTAAGAREISYRKRGDYEQKDCEAQSGGGGHLGLEEGRCFANAAMELSVEEF